MTGKTHVIVGVVSCAVVGIDKFPSVTLGGLDVYPIAGLLTAALTAKWADYDMSNSNAAIAHKMLAKIFTHRGMTHTLMFPLGIAYILLMFIAAPNVVTFQFLASLIFGALVGYVSHIWADNLNQKGTPTLWPICRERIHVMSIATGTLQETAFLAVFCAVCFLQVVLTLGGKIL